MASKKVDAPVTKAEKKSTKPVMVVDLPREALTYIAVKELQPSPHNPRKEFDKVRLDELAGSIAKKGVLEPLLVRSVNGHHEIIAGERRWRAAKIAKLTEVPTIVKTLDDAAIIEMQIHENLHRDDLAPLDEAEGYAFYLKHGIGNGQQLSVEDLAVKVGKTVPYVHQRLKLNELVDDGKTELRKGRLPLGHAMELAKYAPEIQEYAMKEFVWQGWATSVNEQRNHQVAPLSRLRESIKSRCLRDLSRAPFSLKDKTLREDGLTCVDCPSRLGAAPSLFELQAKEGDRCLVPECFAGKARQHIVNLTVKNAKVEVVKGKQETKPAPIIARDPKDFAGSLKDGTYRDLSYETGKKKTCPSTEVAISAESHNFGEKVNICRDPKCKVHKDRAVKAATSNAAEAKKAEEATEERRRRKEEIFDARVAERVRAIVIGQAAQKYAVGFMKEKVVNATAFAPWFGGFIVACWYGLMSMNEHAGNFAVDIVKGWFKGFDGEDGGVKVLDSVSRHSRGDSYAKVREWVMKQTPDLLAAVIFLLDHAHEGEILSDYYRDQTPVRRIASAWDINYQLIDAQIRLEEMEQRSKKHVPAFKEYLTAVEAGKDATIPRPYNATWNPQQKELEQLNAVVAEKPQKSAKTKAAKGA